MCRQEVLGQIACDCCTYCGLLHRRLTQQLLAATAGKVEEEHVSQRPALGSVRCLDVGLEAFVNGVRRIYTYNGRDSLLGAILTVRSALVPACSGLLVLDINRALCLAETIRQDAALIYAVLERDMVRAFLLFIRGVGVSSQQSCMRG